MVRRRPRRRHPLPLAVATLLAAATLAGCGDDDAGPDNEASASPSTTADTATAVASQPAEPTCDDGTFAERRYILCTAGSGDEQGLVVALHGRGSSAQEMRTATELDRVAAARGLAVVYPDALDGGWGDDMFTTPTRPSGDEDLVFLDGLVDDLRADPRIGDDPIGVVGFSNGASMALRYASQRPDDVRAVVAVAGQLPRDPAVRPRARVPLLEVYGTADPVRSYETGIPESPGRRPGDPTPTLPTADTVAAFVAAAGTGGSVDHEGPEETDPDPSDGTRVRTERWTDADGTVAILQSIVDGGHTWPSSRAQFTGGQDFGPTSTDVDASADAIAFVLDPNGAS